MDTIFALASGSGKAGVAVIRVSGPNLGAVMHAFGCVVPPGGRGLRAIRWQGDLLDHALVLHFPVGKSFTGEEVLEIHTHGSRAVVNAVMAALSDLPGLRLAEAGEFTRRAFENGCLDLTQVEGLGDLIDAETEAQRRQAQKLLSGALRSRVDTWSAALLQIQALFTAGIDFADEEIPESVNLAALDQIRSLKDELEQELAQSRAAEIVRDGFEVAIIGAPNAGKSTLLNYIARRDVAIVSEIAGTTRDVIECRIDLAGHAVILLDTAGLRATNDVVETKGIERARERARAADLRVFLVDDNFRETAELEQNGDLILRGKSDLRDGDISGVTGAGVDTLLAEIERRVVEMAGTSGLAAHERHRRMIGEAVDHLSAAIESYSRDGDWVIASELVAGAGRSLEGLVGRIDVEAVLGEIFSQFCVGK